jgi:hypothetical protein
MADYTVSLNNRQENALQKMVDNENMPVPLGRQPLTKQDMIERLALGPIKEMVRQIRLQQDANVSEAFDAADPTVQAQIRTLLGL